MLVSHGSRSPRPAEEKAALTAKLQMLYPHVTVRAAYLELAEPSVMQGLLEFEQEGVKELLVLPLMLFPATHVSEDIPDILQNYRMAGGSMKVHYGTEIGASDRIISAAAEAIRQTDGVTGRLVLLVKGSSNPVVAKRGKEVLERLQEMLQITQGRLCFTGNKRPSLAATLIEAAADDVEDISVCPFFLFSGRLLDRAENSVEGFVAANPEINVKIAPVLYDQPGVLDALADQIFF